MADVALALNLHYIRAKQVNIPKIGNQGQNGTLKEEYIDEMTTLVQPINGYFAE